MFFKIGSNVVKNLAILTGKHLCWSLFLIKLPAWRSAAFLKVDSNKGFSCGHGEIFKNNFLIEHLQWLLLIVLPRYSKVSWVSVLWFGASTCIRFWSKTYTTRCINNSLLSRDKTIYCLLELIGHALSISEYGKILVAFDFDEKLILSVAQLTM